MKQEKVLYVVRHAKSSWEYDGIADIDRTLKSKGIQSAYEVSRKLKMDDHIPDRILSSPANRALHTAVIFARILDYPLEHLIICKTLYESSADKILTLIKNTPQNYRSLMIFGHNPDVTHLVDHFVKMSEDLPTSGVATLVFNSETWNGITPENLDHKSFFFPKRDE